MYCPSLPPSPFNNHALELDRKKPSNSRTYKQDPLCLYPDPPHIPFQSRCPLHYSSVCVCILYAPACV